MKMFNFKKFKQQKGFTLLEVLLVIAMLAILAAIVIVAINPAKQLAESRNAQRRADVNTILNATYQYTIDNGGDLPPPLAALADNTATEVCRTGAGACVGLVDMSTLTALKKYIVSVPIDPRPNALCLVGGANSSCYTISKDAANSNRITVAAPSAEQGAVISVTR